MMLRVMVKDSPSLFFFFFGVPLELCSCQLSLGTNVVNFHLLPRQEKEDSVGVHMLLLIEKTAKWK